MEFFVSLCYFVTRVEKGNHFLCFWSFILPTKSNWTVVKGKRLRSLWILLLIRVSWPQHYWLFRRISLCCEAVLYIGECSAPSLASRHLCQKHPSSQLWQPELSPDFAECSFEARDDPSRVSVSPGSEHRPLDLESCGWYPGSLWPSDNYAVPLFSHLGSDRK